MCDGMALVIAQSSKVDMDMAFIWQTLKFTLSSNKRQNTKY